MIILGIILVLIAAAIGLLGVWAASQATLPAFTTTVLNSTWEISPLMLFLGGMAIMLLLWILGGMAIMLLLWIGLRLFGFGTRRTVSKRREHKELLRTQHEQERALAETQKRLGTTQQARVDDRTRLAAEREQERTRDAQLRVETDQRRVEGREDEIRKLAAERDQSVRRDGIGPTDRPAR